MKKIWLRLILVALLGLLCISLIACTDPDSEKEPPETTAGETTAEEITAEKPVDTNPLDEKVGNQGENTNPEWGNDVIA